MDPVIAAVVFLFGLAFGSFLNVCIHRLPRRILLQEELGHARHSARDLPVATGAEAAGAAVLAEVSRLEREVAGYSVVHPQSACPKCHTPIRPYDNIPVVSWLLLRGRCRHCDAPISPRYVVVELLTALLFVACYWRFGLNLGTLKFCVFSFLIVGLTFIDAEWKLLPDAFTVPGLVVGLALSLLVPLFDVVAPLLVSVYPGLGFGQNLRWVSLAESAAGAIFGGASFYLLSLGYKYARGREGLGLGDVKLMAMVGAFIGLRLTVLTIFGASLAGSAFGITTLLVVWNRRTQRRIENCREPKEVARKRAWRSAQLIYANFGIPFGVFLGPMALVSVFFGRFILHWYGGLF